MSRKSLARSLVVAIALCVMLVLVGRWERERAGRRAVAGIAAVRAVVGTPFAAGEAKAFLRGDRLTCLLYTRGRRLLGVSLCYDDAGRLVEATDAREGEPKVWTVRMDRELARERIDPRRVQAVVDALSLHATLEAVLTTAVHSVSHRCLLHLGSIVGEPPGPRLLARVRPALAECRETAAAIVELGATHLGSAPGVREPVQAYIEILRDTIGRLGALEAALESGADSSEEMRATQVLNDSTRLRLEAAGAALRQAIAEATGGMSGAPPEPAGGR